MRVTHGRRKLATNECCKWQKQRIHDSNLTIAPPHGTLIAHWSPSIAQAPIKWLRLADWCQHNPATGRFPAEIIFNRLRPFKKFILLSASSWSATHVKRRALLGAEKRGTRKIGLQRFSLGRPTGFHLLKPEQNPVVIHSL